MNNQPWSSDEQQLLEQALKTYPASTEERWEKISSCIPNRSKKDCMRRYKVNFLFFFISNSILELNVIFIILVIFVDGTTM